MIAYILTLIFSVPLLLLEFITRPLRRFLAIPVVLLVMIFGNGREGYWEIEDDLISNLKK